MAHGDSDSGLHLFLFGSDFTAFGSSESSVRALTGLAAEALRVDHDALTIVDYPRKESSDLMTAFADVAKRYRNVTLRGCYFVWLGSRGVRKLITQLDPLEAALHEFRALRRVILVPVDSWPGILKEFDHHEGARSFSVGSDRHSKRTYIMPHKRRYSSADVTFLKVFLHSPDAFYDREEDPTVEFFPTPVDPNKTIPG